MTQESEDINLYFKGVILPKKQSTNYLIDFENGFVLTDERKEDIKKFSSLEVYNAIKKQNPQLLKTLLDIDIKGFDKKEFEKYLEKDGIKTPKQNKPMNNLFSSLNDTLNKIFYKNPNISLCSEKIKTKDESLCLGWFKTNIFEMYIFADLKSATLMEYYVSGHTSTLKKDINSDVLNGYKRFLNIYKEEFSKTISTNIEIGANTINKAIVEKHFLKNPKYYIVQLDLKEYSSFKLYITLKKAKSV